MYSFFEIKKKVLNQGHITCRIWSFMSLELSARHMIEKWNQVNVSLYSGFSIMLQEYGNIHLK